MALLKRDAALRRDLSLAAGVLLLAAALSPPLASLAHHDLRAHMAQHLLIGMVAPVFLVLGAPFGRLLRALPAPTARLLVRVLHSRPGRLWTHPFTALLLNAGGLYLLYLTPLYAAAQHSPALHGFVNLHFLAAGYLFTWAVLAWPEAPPRPPTFALRLCALFLSMAAHALLAKWMYAFGWPRGTHHAIGEIQDAARLMYYGGDLAELLLAVLLFTRWYARSPHTRNGLRTFSRAEAAKIG